MAPLYKRYIPPKTPATATAEPVKQLHQSIPVPTQDEAPKKRKRERTEEEIAERKAKKLRKKGIDPATVLDSTAKYGNKSVSVSTKTSSPSKEPTTSTKSVESEFAHVKNTKKRHKLEKEARKARKAEIVAQNGDNRKAEPARTNGDQSHDINTEGGSDAVAGSVEAINGDTLSNSDRIRPLEVSAKSDADPLESGSRALRKNHGIRAATEVIANDEHPGTGQRNGSPARPRKRRHKLESVLEQPQWESERKEDEDAGHLRKHQGVMHKFQKSKAISQATPKQSVPREQSPSTAPVILDLGPLPQPDKAPTPEFVPDSSALPEWLAKPTVISNDTKKPFKNLNLDPKVVDHLSKFGFKDSMPVQEALIPLLLPPGTSGARFMPGTESLLPDIAVGAPTGSGKTIAYLLPLIESLRRTAGLGRLKALVVVPTRELVMQVAAVGESLARGSGLKIGMATGTGNFKDEQSKIVRMGRRYDPVQYQTLIARAHRRNYPPSRDSDEFEEYLNDVETQDARENQRIEATVSCLVDHIPTYESAVDILVATPGRLLEHLGVTLGFSLAYLEWLVLDEADKLIDQQYHGFLRTINEQLDRPRSEEEQDAREEYLRSKGRWNEHRERRVRKVMLSATMTRDISKLVDLKLKRPQLVVVRGQDDMANGITHHSAEPSDRQSGALREVEDAFELSPNLREYCIHVGDGSEKPLYVAELLSRHVLAPSGVPEANHHTSSPDHRLDDSDASDIEPSKSGSISSKDDESDVDLPSDHESNTDEDYEAEKDDQADRLQSSMDIDFARHPERTAMLEHPSLHKVFDTAVPTILVFTSSTETANRLSHLLKYLHPELASAIHTITAADKSKNPFSKSQPNEPIIAISTDRTARGLDAIAGRPITHVLQYDVPRSVTGYVHRVGRTARAGRFGEAWTLYTHSEARWFLNEVAKAKTVKRIQPVEKFKLPAVDEGSQEKLKEAIASMRDEVYRPHKGSAQR